MPITHAEVCVNIATTHRSELGEDASISPEDIGDLLARAFAELDEAVVIADTRRRILYANAAFSTTFGYAPGEMHGRETSVLYADTAGFQARGEAVFRTDAPAGYQRYQAQYQRKDGSAFTGETTGGPIHDDEGETIGFVGIITDVSRRVSAQALMRDLHRITSDRSLDLGSRIMRILELGTKHLGLPLGICSRIEASTYTIVHIVGGSGVGPGDTFSLGNTYCDHTWRADDVVGFHHMGRSLARKHPCYKTFGLEAYIGAPIVVDGERFGTINFSSPLPAPAPFSGEDVEFVRLFADWIGHELARQRDQDELAALARTDPLTGLLNRRATHEALMREARRAARYDGPVCMALIDLDHFKRVNDRYGHDAGDHTLQTFASIVQDTLRDVDRVGRWGGEEFVVLLPGTPIEGARLVCERLLQALRSRTLEHGGNQFSVTGSIGVAAFEEGMELPGWIKLADERAYQAKAAGRDRVIAE